MVDHYLNIEEMWWCPHKGNDWSSKTKQNPQKKNRKMWDFHGVKNLDIQHRNKLFLQSFILWFSFLLSLVYFLLFACHFHEKKERNWIYANNKYFICIQSLKYLASLCHRAPLLSKSTLKTHQWTILLHWVTWSFITMRTHKSFSIPHALRCTKTLRRSLNVD